MKTYRYVEPDENFNPIEVTMTEADILSDYYPWWKEQLIKAGKEHLLSEERCVEDWVVCHWAWELRDEDI